MAQRNVYRVSYETGGRSMSAMVCAESGTDAVAFLGVANVSPAVSEVARDVEVVGIDKAHPVIAEAEVFKAPPAPPVHVTRKEFEDLEKQLKLLTKQLAEANAKS